MGSLISLWNTIQSSLFPWLEEELDPLTEKQKYFISVTPGCKTAWGRFRKAL